MRKLILSLILISLYSCKKNSSLQTDDEKALYAIGYKIGSRLKNFDLSHKELLLVNHGMKEALFSKKELGDYSELIQDFTERRSLTLAEKNKNKGLTFTEKKLKEGFQQTESGLLYKIIREGNDTRAKIVDSVVVNYEGSSIEGEVFDSSYEDDDKITLPLNSVIKGWREALKLIGERGKIEIIVPSNLAYGDKGSYPDIEPGETLQFKIDLYKVEKFN